MRGLWIVLVLAAGTAFAGESPGPVRALVTIAPQADVLRQVGGAEVEVSVLVPPGQSHETYEVTPRQMEAMGRAEVFFTIGLALEKNLELKLSSASPGLRIVSMREGVSLLPMDSGDGDAAGHGHAHGHDGMDPHIWLDPVRVKTQAAVAAKTLSELRPEKAAFFEGNRKQFEAALDALTVEIQTMLEPVRGRALFVYHPAYGYFTNRFGLRQVAIEQDGKEPGLKHIQAVVEAIRAEGSGALFVQPQLSGRSASMVASEAGVRTVTLDPLPVAYANDLRALARAVLEGLRREDQ